MKIEQKDVLHIAQLSRLQFSSSQMEEMENHLQTVVGYFEMLDSVDTSKVSPTAHIIDKFNVLREDEATTKPFDREELLKNAPEAQDGCYVVPRVVE